MALDSIKAGLKVFTNARLTRHGGTVGGGIEGLISSVVRHPVNRNILAVVVDPGTGDPEDLRVVSPRNLRLVEAA